ncbi:MAG TPA: carotenoid oxygenase family protein, partial [Dongiaceae bacterium]|nr:carotenoid oxygenase family protein [Dongiaceae bacterium]
QLNRLKSYIAEPIAMTAIAASRATSSAVSSPYLALYSSAPAEQDEFLNPLSGKVPSSLEGTLFRNGPARWNAGDFQAQHLFDGDGMMGRFQFAQGKVHYRSRYVQTPKVRAERQGKTMRGLGSQRPGGILANAFRLLADRANTHAVMHAGKLLALSDDGRPWVLDADTLATRGRTRFNRELPRLSLFSPHPRIDPNTGELFNFGLVRSGGFRAGLRCYRVDPNGAMRTLATVPLDHLYINHDFAITEHYLVFVLAPVIVDPIKAIPALLGLSTFEAASGYRDDIGTRIVLVPRDGGKLRIVECPPLVYVHFNNAFEQQDSVVVDLVRHAQWDGVANALRHFRTEAAPGGHLTRIRISSNNRVEMEDLCAQAGEFPNHDTRRTGREHRFSYFPSLQRTIIKLDHDTGRHQQHEFGALDMIGEPIFVPMDAQAGEDEGWVLSIVYRHAEHRTDLVILDARDFEADPLAVLPLPEPIFPGFHGSFVPS